MKYRLFLLLSPKMPPFPESGGLISRIVQVLGFPDDNGQGVAISRIGAVSRPKKGYLVSRIGSGRSPQWLAAPV